MTLQIMRPDDSGDIHTRTRPEIGALPVGERTINLGPYVAGAMLARRPDATGEIPAVLPPLDEAPADHDTVTNLRRPALYARTRPGGRHRRPTRWDRLVALVKGTVR